MMAGNPRGWSMHPPDSEFHPSSSIPFDSLPPENQEHPHQTLSQLLMGGLSEEEDRYGLSEFQQQIMNMNTPTYSTSSSSTSVAADNKKQEVLIHHLYGLGDHEDQFQTLTPKWSHQQVIPVSSPRSCVTTLSSNMLDFSYTNNPDGRNRNPHTDQSISECNSIAAVPVCKKARVQPTASQPPLKVRKEKLGDRITALHQLVSPFGKTDTASVLLEAIGYIRFLQGQIEALSSPYLTAANTSNIRNQHSVQGERNSVFPEDPGQDSQDIKAKDLKSRGLCLVPLSCTQHVGNDNGADYWAPAMGGGF